MTNAQRDTMYGSADCEVQVGAIPKKDEWVAQRVKESIKTQCYIFTESMVDHSKVFAAGMLAGDLLEGANQLAKKVHEDLCEHWEYEFEEQWGEIK